MLDDLIAKYAASGALPMHMPGHKRKSALLGGNLPWNIDITEIDGFDDLYDARGVLKEISDRASALYGSRRAYLLVNGSTGGLLTAVSAAVRYGDTVLLARNCHHSVYHAVEINGLRPVYLYPERDAETGIAGSVTPGSVEEALEAHPDARLVILVSPTYEGVVSDIKAICSIAHRRGVPVLVDEAHGAHLGFSDYFPKEAVKSGADLAVMSLHKTLPALTQSALLHAGGSHVDLDRLNHLYAVYQTSSPSYVLMASIDRCLRLLEDQKTALFSQYEKHLRTFSDAMKGLNRLGVLCRGKDDPGRHPAFYGFDPGKIDILSGMSGLSGMEIAGRLRTDDQIELEMAGVGHAVAMTSICDGEADFEWLASALRRLDRDAADAPEFCPDPAFPVPEQAMTPADAMRRGGTVVRPEQAAGRISLEYVWVYPPGIPMLVPGETIGEETLHLLADMDGRGVRVRTTRGRYPGGLYVL